MCYGFASFLLLLTIWLVAGGCWLSQKGLSSMKQQIHALTNRKTDKKGKGHHSISVRSLARNTMISSLLSYFFSYFF